ncbi:methyltransferase domain protein [Leptospira inadai serovar Lyme str. 10]|uniref:Methyltransferase domain protein n=2 Tax=Leptospira inadai serovar Lyme TaxID=293084 RepID=V6HPL1_9LEPT|nr:class I SAM-dependent methyltransferase [Leptospira inadai]EQA38810.1 methyltransferase domain protein [Leptospira inadai serovar Lyme str. 10]PNV74101.1 class I SAM-dependent methyltransferase [Leptospira inadai serovar Lyme]
MEYVESFEGDRAKAYDERIVRMIPFYDGVQELVATLLLEFVKENSGILCAGCGTGADFQKLLEVAPDRYSITGVDPSPEMISQAKIKYPSLRFECCTVQNLPVDIAYAGATLLFVLHFLPDDGAKLSLLQEIAKRLEPGSTFILFDLCDPSPHNRDFIFRSAESYLKNFKEWKSSELKLYIKRVKRLHRISEFRYQELFHAAGFSNAQQVFQAMHVCGWVVFKN